MLPDGPHVSCNYLNACEISITHQLEQLFLTGIGIFGPNALAVKENECKAKTRLVYSIHSCQMKSLQTIHNALARAVTKIPKHPHIHVTPVQKSLHWLKVHPRIHYKITYNTLQSSYIRQLG